jgi:hypothetical protein
VQQLIGSIDELTMTIFVSSASAVPLPVRMYNYIANTIDPLLASVSTVIIVLTLLLMLLLGRLFGLDRVLFWKSMKTDNVTDLPVTSSGVTSVSRRRLSARFCGRSCVTAWPV